MDYYTQVSKKFREWHWVYGFLGEMQRIAFRLMLSSCVCASLCVCAAFVDTFKTV